MTAHDDDSRPEQLTGGRYVVAGAFRRMVGLAHLEKRIHALESEMVVYRASHVRQAELIDLVQELLLPLARRDEEKVDSLLAKFTDELGT